MKEINYIFSDIEDLGLNATIFHIFFQSLTIDIFIEILFECNSYIANLKWRRGNRSNGFSSSLSSGFISKALYQER